MSISTNNHEKANRAVMIENFNPYGGNNCETTTLINLLRHQGIMLSEPMIFGIGEGLNFIYWNSKQMDVPFLGGRCKQDLLTQNVVKHLNLEMTINETTSISKAWEQVKSTIENGIPVGLKLDSYYLEYFTHKIHFAAHYVTIYGYNEKYGYLVDTKQQGAAVKSSLTSIAEARNARGPMSSRNRSFSIKKTKDLPDLKEVIISAVHNNAKEYLHPPIKNLSYKGIQLASTLIPKWLDKDKISPTLIKQAGQLMEKAGTGGALFRNMYRDFLKECTELYPELNFEEAYQNFTEIALKWTKVSELICLAGEKQTSHYLYEAASLMEELSIQEERTMGLLLHRTSNEN